MKAKASHRTDPKGKVSHRADPKGFALSDMEFAGSPKRKAYEEELARLQLAFAVIQQAYIRSKDKAVIVFEGWDAAGKGGTIRRLSARMDPRGFRVWPIGAPRPYFKERHYLQRFWERLPANGEIVVFDRSWYGRVLVERVEGFAEIEEWKRAYDEINEFERLLRDDGVRIIKIFLHISQDEQMQRFLARLNEPTKRWKLTADDFRNRGKWADYVLAVEDMVQRTSTAEAPWHVIPANSKRYARIAALAAIRAALADGVDLAPPPADAEIVELAKKLAST